MEPSDRTKRKHDELEEEKENISKVRKHDSESMDEQAHPFRLFLKNLLSRLYTDQITYKNYFTSIAKTVERQIRFTNAQNQLSVSVELDIRFFPKQDYAKEQGDEESFERSVSPSSLRSSEVSLATNLNDLQNVNIFQTDGLPENSLNYVIEVAVYIKISEHVSPEKVSISLLLCPPIDIFVNFHPESHSIKLIEPGVDFSQDNIENFPAKINYLTITFSQITSPTRYSLLTNTFFQVVKQSILRSWDTSTQQPEDSILQLIEI